MHYDPLISSRAKSLVSWGHDWVVLCLIVVNPFWAPTKVFALPITMRLYRNRQGLTKGKKGRGKGSKPNPDHRTRPELARELIHLVAQWYLTMRSSLPATAPMGARASCRTADERSPHQPRPSQGCALRACSRREETRQRNASKKCPPTEYGSMGQRCQPTLDRT